MIRIPILHENKTSTIKNSKNCHTPRKKGASLDYHQKLPHKEPPNDNPIKKWINQPTKVTQKGACCVGGGK